MLRDTVRACNTQSRALLSAHGCVLDYFADYSMNGSKIDNWLARLALILSAGLCLAWLGGWSGGGWPLRAATLAAGLTLAGVSVLVLQRRRRRDHRAVQRYFEALCRLGSPSSFADPSDADLPPLPPGNQWSGIAERMRDTVWRLHRRVRELEQTHTFAGSPLPAGRRASRANADTFSPGWPTRSSSSTTTIEIVLANRSAEELFNIPGDKAEAKALQQLIHCQKLVQLLSSTRQRKAAVHRTDEVEIADPEGQSHWYRATAVKLAAQAAEGQQDAVAEGAVAVLRDIGDQKTLQKRNAEFVSAVSHEMKTPLAGIKAYVELLADGDAEDEATREEFLERHQRPGRPVAAAGGQPVELGPDRGRRGQREQTAAVAQRVAGRGPATSSGPRPRPSRSS